MKKEVEIKNLELTLHSLKQDVEEAAKSLTKIYKDKDEAVKQQTDAVEKREKEEQKVEKLKQYQTEISNNILAEKQNLSITLDYAHQKVNKAQKLEKKAIEKLIKTNNLIEGASQDLDALVHQKDILGEQLMRRAELLMDVEDIKKEIGDLRDERNIEMANLNKLEADYQDTLKELNTTLSEHRKETKDLEERAELAKQRNEDFSREYQKRKKDLEIIVNRIEKEYQRTFPNRQLKI